MAYLLPEALKMAQNPMLAGIIRDIVTTDELAALIPFEPVAGTSIKFAREGTLPSTLFIPDSGATTEESSGLDDVVEVQFRRIVGNVDSDLLAEEVGVTGGPSRNRLAGKKAKATWRLVKDKLINGGHTTSHNYGLQPVIAGIPLAEGTGAADGIVYGPHLDSARRGPGSLKYTHAGTLWQFRAPGDVDYGPAVAVAADSTVTLTSWNPSFYIDITVDVSDITADDEVLIYFASSNDEFEGLNEMIPAAQTVPVVGVNGDAYSIAMLDELISLQKVRDGRAFIMNSKQIENHYGALRALGGIHPEHVAIPGYAGQVPTYRGIPILHNDNITNYTVGSGTVSRIYLGSLNPDEGLVLAAATGGSVISPDADPRTRPVLGFRIENIGPLEAKDAVRTRVKWYGAPVLKSNLAFAVREGVVE